MNKKVSRIIGSVMLVVAVGFIIFALSNPQASFPWNNVVTYSIYIVYIISMIIFLIAPFKD